MEHADDRSKQVLDQAEQLIMEMQEGNEEKTAQVLAQLGSIRESLLYQEVGKMTRQLHNSLQGFREDARLDSMTAQDIPDARQRLLHVIELTQKSADQTLSAVENSMPLAESIATEAGELSSAWKKFKRRELSVDQFRELSSTIEKFLGDIETDAGAMKQNLNQVLMAQEFQDLTSQILKKVIDLVEEVEGNLVELMRLTGGMFGKPESADEGSVSAIEAEGPYVPGTKAVSENVSSQDEVDDLLSSLGF
ncbi:MAG: protein phosphatase CheZ [Gammaproteobacteria bacterium]|nr:protein phosphatase CheZ [Gammaproteobacteria bacterium]MDH5802637.1 protein phosphatase CheZ [Gammaproteobacteria bacterium]